MNLPKSISLSGGVSLDILEKSGAFIGFGRISVKETSLRSGQRPMFVDIRNPSAVQLSNYQVSTAEISPEKITLRFSMHREESGSMEWMVHEVRPRYATTDWSAAPGPAEDTQLELELLPVQRTIGGRAFVGFSYRYHYQSGSIPIYKILDRATWEPGGSVLGAEFWMRNCFVSPIQRFDSTAQFYSTEWYLRNCANPSVFQFLPLQTELQGFTFTASNEGLLLTWATDVAHIRSLFEKPRGTELMVHWHEHCGDLAHDLSTAPVEVLWSAGPSDRVQRANTYEAVRALVHETLHRKAGLRQERVSTYGQIEEWTPADIDQYRRVGLPRLTEAGVKEIYLANHFENNMNTWGVSNFCCTVDYKVAESVGETKLRDFCAEARAAGVQVQMWANTSISTLTWMFDMRNGDSDRVRFLPKENSIMAVVDRETAFVRNASNAIEADHYTPIFAVLNLRDPKVRAYWLMRWREAKDCIGLSSIFLDSSFNLSSDKFHYIQNTDANMAGATADQVALLGKQRLEVEPPAAILSQYLAHLDLMAEMQKMGYAYCNEDLGVFGIHRHGPDIVQRLDSLFIWADCIANFEPRDIRAAGHNPDDIFFRSLAYRQMWSVYWDIDRDRLTMDCRRGSDPESEPSSWHLSLLRAYNLVEGFMIERTILPGEKGVLYRAPNRWVLWAFGEMELPLPDACTEVLSQKEVLKTDAARRVPRGIYLSTTL